MAITAAMVKELREKTGAGMMDCKKALVESDGDHEKAVVYLREKGLAKAAKKAGRATSEGVVGNFIAADGKSGALVELKCETDFVAKNEDFQAFAAKLAEQVTGMDVTVGTADDLGDAADVTDLIAKLGENMAVGRFAKLTTEGSLGLYIHSNSKIGVLTDMTGGDEQLGKDIAMQIAATNPLCLVPAELPQDALEKEKAIFLKQAMDEGKPEEIAQKIVMGRLSKYYKEVCLTEQPFIKEDKLSIKQLLKDKNSSIGGFVRLALGEDAE